MLKQIKAEDLLFTNDIEDDRTNTFLKLNDYDWMEYQLKTRFRTEEQGILNVTFEYFGFTVSRMNVEQEIQNTEKTKNYIYEFDSNIFKKHIISFLNKHIEFNANV